jgi:hypothetical protein
MALRRLQKEINDIAKDSTPSQCSVGPSPDNLLLWNGAIMVSEGCRGGGRAGENGVRNLVLMVE